MHEILRNLGEGDRVLDLGSGPGSFAAELYPWLRIIRLDAEFPSPVPDGGFVQANAGQLPFADGSFKAIVSNHSLEHMAELKTVIPGDRPGGATRRRLVRGCAGWRHNQRSPLPMDLPWRRPRESLSIGH